MGLPKNAGHKFYHGKGCSSCFHTGYRGRMAVFEILVINSKLREAIARGDKREKLEKIVNESGHYVTLRDNARRLVLEGTTTVEEARRIINSADYDYEG
ncbi:hypothetical protein SDC9_173330 [bioreactor metagenome]|uniref:Bacterial type II secretion system protein E domain-containing protein n=1 Tax=bioreactor metagenome TaxID=1076179 RepID=A0A645GJB2_9ZZZZ